MEHVIGIQQVQNGVAVASKVDGVRIQKVVGGETYKTWILVREERCWRQPSHSWTSWVSLGESATASRSCCSPVGGFCSLRGETVTSCAQRA